jgi:hypothetical protein
MAGSVYVRFRYMIYATMCFFCCTPSIIHVNPSILCVCNAKLKIKDQTEDKLCLHYHKIFVKISRQNHLRQTFREETLH